MGLLKDEHKLIHEVDLGRNWKVWAHYSATAHLSMLPWCEENCIGKYSNSFASYTWRFEKLEDAVAFKLRWDGCGY